MTDYTHHARVLDRDHHHHDFRTTGTWGPVERRLQSFTTVRGLVFGQFGEASADVHDLLRAAARLRGDREWRLAGARTATEMRAFLVSMMRRRMGLAAVQAMARHRIARVPYIGVPRAIVQTRMQRGTVAGQAYAPAPGHADFYQFQVNRQPLGAAA